MIARATMTEAKAFAWDCLVKLERGDLVGIDRAFKDTFGIQPIYEAGHVSRLPFPPCIDVDFTLNPFAGVTICKAYRVMGNDRQLLVAFLSTESEEAARTGIWLHVVSIMGWW